MTEQSLGGSVSSEMQHPPDGVASGCRGLCDCPLQGTGLVDLSGAGSFGTRSATTPGPWLRCWLCIWGKDAQMGSIVWAVEQTLCEQCSGRQAGPLPCHIPARGARAVLVLQAHCVREAGNHLGACCSRVARGARHAPLSRTEVRW